MLYIYGYIYLHLVDFYGEIFGYEYTLHGTYGLMFEDKLLLAYDLVTTTIVPNDAVGQWSFQQDGFPSLPLPKCKPHRWAVVGIGWHWCSELRHRVQMEAAQLGGFYEQIAVIFVHPRKLTWNLKIFPWKMRNIYKTCNFWATCQFVGVYLSQFLNVTLVRHTTVQ